MSLYSVSLLEGGEGFCQSPCKPTVPRFCLSEGSERSWSTGCDGQNNQGRQHVCMWLIRTSTYLAISVVVAIFIFLVHKENMSLIKAEMRQTANTLEVRHALELQRLESRFAGLEAEVRQNLSSVVEAELEYDSGCSWLDGWQQDQALKWCKVGVGVQAYRAANHPSDRVTVYRVMLPDGRLDWGVYQNVCAAWRGCSGGMPVAYFAHYENGTVNIDNGGGDIRTTMSLVGTDSQDAAKYEKLCVGDSVWTGGCCYGPNACNDGNSIIGQRYALCGCPEF